LDLVINTRLDMDVEMDFVHIFISAQQKIHLLAMAPDRSHSLLLPWCSVHKIPNCLMLDLTTVVTPLFLDFNSLWSIIAISFILLQV
jgi:hypothetical protein